MYDDAMVEMMIMIIIFFLWKVPHEIALSFFSIYRSAPSCTSNKKQVKFAYMQSLSSVFIE